MWPRALADCLSLTRLRRKTHRGCSSWAITFSGMIGPAPGPCPAGGGPLRPVDHARGSARAPVAPERQTGGRPLHGPRSASALVGVPDHLIQSVRLEKGPQVLDAGIAVASEQLVCDRRAVAASPGARHEPADVPRDGAVADVFEVVPDQ